MARPRVARLDRERIAAAALELIDRDGDFTMPDLATRLNVQVSSIYHHAPGRAAVIELVRRRVASTIDPSVFATTPWDEALTAWARSYREAFSRHTGAIRLLATGTVRDPGVVESYRAAARSLRAAGFPAARIMSVITATESFLLGSALDAAAPAVVVDAGPAPEHDRPHDALAEALAAAPATPSRAEQAFEVGLRALIDGFRAQLAALVEPE